MALFIPDMAGHLFLVILLFDNFQYIEAQGHYQGHHPKPDIIVHFDVYFNVICLIPGSVSPDTTCNLYVGEESQPSFTAKIKKRKETSESRQQFCQFTPKHSDLISRLQSVRSKEVSCDYRVSSGPNSLSPRSDGYSFTDLVGVHITDPTTKPFPTGRAGNRWHTDSRVGDRYAGTDWQRQGVSETFRVILTPHSTEPTAPLITTSEISTGNPTDPTLTPMGKETFRVILTPHSTEPTAPLITTSEISTGNTTDPTLTQMGKEPLDFLWRHILTVCVLLATCGLIIHYVISHQCPKAVPKRSRRGDKSNEDISLTVC